MPKTKWRVVVTLVDGTTAALSGHDADRFQEWWSAPVTNSPPFAYVVDDEQTTRSWARRAVLHVEAKVVG